MLYITGKLQIKTRYHCTPIRTAKIQNNIKTNADEDVGQQEPSFTAGGNAKWYTLEGGPRWCQ